MHMYTCFGEQKRRHVEIIMDAAYISAFFDRIPGIISQASRHLHDTDFEVIERIRRRLGDSLFSEPSCQ